MRRSYLLIITLLLFTSAAAYGQTTGSLAPPCVFGSTDPNFKCLGMATTTGGIVPTPCASPALDTTGISTWTAPNGTTTFTFSSDVSTATSIVNADHAHFNGRCPICIRQGKKSKVWPGGSTSTLMGSLSYYDEDGVYHNEDPNITTTDYSCSLGHNFSVSQQRGKETITEKADSHLGLWVGGSDGGITSATLTDRTGMTTDYNDHWFVPHSRLPKTCISGQLAKLPKGSRWGCIDGKWKRFETEQQRQQRVLSSLGYPKNAHAQTPKTTAVSRAYGVVIDVYGIAINIEEGQIEHAREFVAEQRRVNKNAEINDVSVTYKGKTINLSFEEFLKRVGFDEQKNAHAHRPTEWPEPIDPYTGKAPIEKCSAGESRFYITGLYHTEKLNGLTLPPLAVCAKDRLYAITGIGATVWTEGEWQEWVLRKPKYAHAQQPKPAPLTPSQEAEAAQKVLIAAETELGVVAAKYREALANRNAALYRIMAENSIKPSECATVSPDGSPNPFACIKVGPTGITAEKLKPETAKKTP